MTKNYDESSIKVLRGLDPVRQRPGMYTNLDSPHHMIAEVIDNACDEALAGYAKNVYVTAHTDNSISVQDDGRGIPVGIHPEEKVSTVQVAFTVLHSGGKFDKEGEDGAYQFAGGLHGVGVAVTNALSRKVEVTVRRDGGEHFIRFIEGSPESPLSRIGSCDKRSTGTWVRAWPNPKYFDSPTVPLSQLERSLRSKAVLLPGVIISLHIEKTGETKTWSYPDGLRGYLAESLSDGEMVTPIFAQEKYCKSGDGSGFANGEGVSWAMAWALGTSARETFVNLIPTYAGGTHEAGLRDAAFNSVKTFADIHGLLPKGIKLVPEDVFSRLSFILSAKILDPQFQGQTKDKLVSRDALKLVSAMVKDPLDLWLNENLEPAKRIVELAVQQAQARLRSAQKVEKRKGTSVAVLPGKLTDCSSSDSSRTELFLVEGDSAGGSAKQGRDKEFQAILPLRGKVLNTFDVEADRLFANNEVHDISVAIGIDPHKPTDTVDLSNIRYGKIIIMADADVDGSHIETLLLTLYFKHFYRVVEAGHIYLARPPLYRVDVPAHGKKPARKIYALNDAELSSIQDRLAKENVRESGISIARFKGLGEMSPEQLWETTLNPDTRRLLRVKVSDSSVGNATSVFTMLMAKQESAKRRAWLEFHGNEVDGDI